MFETHDSWRKKYFIAAEDPYKSWYCFQLKTNRPWFFVKFAYIDDSENYLYIFMGDEGALKNFSEKPDIKIQEVYVVSSPEINHTFLSQMNLLESIYSACDANNRGLTFYLYELVDGRKIAYPSENYTDDLDDVTLVYTTRVDNPLSIPI